LLSPRDLCPSPLSVCVCLIMFACVPVGLLEMRSLSLDWPEVRTLGGGGDRISPFCLCVCPSLQLSGCMVEERKEGKKEERKAGRKEGRKEGMNEGRKEKRKDGKKEEKKKGRKEGGRSGGSIDKDDRCFPPAINLFVQLLPVASLRFVASEGTDNQPNRIDCSLS